MNEWCFLVKSVRFIKKMVLFNGLMNSKICCIRFFMLSLNLSWYVIYVFS